MAIKFHLTIKRFSKKKGKKAPPKEVYEGDVVIQKKDKGVKFYLKGKEKKLLIRASWDSHAEQIFCLSKKNRVRFILKTHLSGKGDITSFSVGGQDADSGKFINWSASIFISEKS